MARKIIDQLFPRKNDSSVTKEENKFVSLKEWKILVSRLDHTQAQIDTCSEKVNVMYSKVMQWFSRVRERLDAVSKNQKEMDLVTKQMFKEWEEKLLNLVQPEQRKEDQKRVMDLMQRHSQFIQSYSQQIDAVKKAVSKNEYQVYQLLEQMRTIRVEMELINRSYQMAEKGSSSRVRSFSSEFNLSP